MSSINRPPKIAIIGAGSVAWSITLIRDIILTPGLKNAHVVLMDINEDRLKLAYKGAVRYAQELHSDIKFSYTMNRSDAIKDADFVINTALAMGHYYYEKMREISEKHGYYRGINSVEWNMVSDYHTIWGYYQFKLALDIAKDVEDLAPNAWLFQVANPVLELTSLIYRMTKVKVIGFCDGPPLAVKRTAEMLKVKESEIEIEPVGFNHDIWATKFRINGEDGYSFLDEWIKNESEKYWKGEWLEKASKNPFMEQTSPAAVDMYKTYGLWPLGDTVRGGTWKYHWNLETKKKWFGPLGGPDSELGWKWYLNMQQEELTRFRKVIEDESKQLTSILPPKIDESDPVVPALDSIFNDNSRILFLNVPNRDLINGLPTDLVVEVPVRVDSKGYHYLPIRQPNSKVLKLALMPRAWRAELALSAFIEGGRDYLFNWLISDVRTKSTNQVEETIDDILKIPENNEMSKHFT